MTALAPVRVEWASEPAVKRGGRPESPLGRPGDARGMGGASEAVGGLTLDELLAGVWDELTVHGAAHCPVCPGEMAPEHSGPGRRMSCCCRSCGTVLS